jgi:hypothetical protein
MNQHDQQEPKLRVSHQNNTSNNNGNQDTKPMTRWLEGDDEPWNAIEYYKFDPSWKEDFEAKKASSTTKPWNGSVKGGE